MPGHQCIDGLRVKVRSFLSLRWVHCPRERDREAEAGQSGGRLGHTSALVLTCLLSGSPGGREVERGKTQANTGHLLHMISRIFVFFKPGSFQNKILHLTHYTTLKLT